MSDSDIRVKPGFLQAIAAEFSDPHIALATCPYRAVAGQSLWSILEAEGMNTEFLAGLLVARLIEGVKFAVGPTIAARKSALQAIGGFSKLKDYLAEDYVMGREPPQAGFGVILSRNTVEHRIGSESLPRTPLHPSALGPEHAPLAPRGLPGTALHLSAHHFVGVDRRRLSLVAESDRGILIPHRRRLGDVGAACSKCNRIGCCCPSRIC